MVLFEATLQNIDRIACKDVFTANLRGWGYLPLSPAYVLYRPRIVRLKNH